MDWGQRLTSAARQRRSPCVIPMRRVPDKSFWTSASHCCDAAQCASPSRRSTSPQKISAVTGRLWAAFPAGDRLRYALVGHGNRYDFYVRRYAQHPDVDLRRRPQRRSGPATDRR